jgi:hypothetical protein
MCWASCTQSERDALRSRGPGRGRGAPRGRRRLGRTSRATSTPALAGPVPPPAGPPPPRPRPRPLAAARPRRARAPRRSGGARGAPRSRRRPRCWRRPLLAPDHRCRPRSAAPLPHAPLPAPAAAPRDVAAAAAVSKDFCTASRAAMRPALVRLHGALRVDKLLPALGPGGTLARLDAHAAEAAALPAAAGDADAVQRGVVNGAVRAVATEWLIEVRAVAESGQGRGPATLSCMPARSAALVRRGSPRSPPATPPPLPPRPRPPQVCWEWKLESTIVFTGVRYLDLWLATTRVPHLNKCAAPGRAGRAAPDAPAPRFARRGVPPPLARPDARLPSYPLSPPKAAGHRHLLPARRVPALPRRARPPRPRAPRDVGRRLRRRRKRRRRVGRVPRRRAPAARTPRRAVGRHAQAAAAAAVVPAAGGGRHEREPRVR